MDVMDDEYEEAIERVREMSDALKLPQTPIDHFIDDALPEGYTMSQETRVAFSYALSIFNVCLGTAAHDAMESDNRESMELKDVVAGFLKMRMNFPEIKAVVEEHKKKRADDEALEASDSENNSDLESEKFDSRDGRLPVTYTISSSDEDDRAKDGDVEEMDEDDS